MKKTTKTPVRQPTLHTTGERTSTMVLRTQWIQPAGAKLIRTTKYKKKYLGGCHRLTGGLDVAVEVGPEGRHAEVDHGSSFQPNQHVPADAQLSRHRSHILRSSIARTKFSSQAAQPHGSLAHKVWNFAGFRGECMMGSRFCRVRVLLPGYLVLAFYLWVTQGQALMYAP